MGSNQSFFQCSKTSKTLFNPKTPQSSSLNILKKPKASISDQNTGYPSIVSASDNDSQSMSTATPSNSQFLSESRKCLENYSIERKLAGSLMLVRCKKDKSQLFVLKIVEKNAFSHSASCPETFIQTLSTISDSAYLAELRHSFLYNSNLYLIMEYCPGGCFLEVLRTQKRFSEDVARFYLCELILGLEAMSRLQGHCRLLGVEDVLLDSEGHIKIANYGPAKSPLEELDCRSEDSDDELRFEGAIKEKKYLKLTKNKSKNQNLEALLFLAPELFEKSPELKVSSRGSEAWLLGILLYVMVVGEFPFPVKKLLESSGGSIERVKKLFMESEPNFPKNMSEECKGLTWGLLRRNPAERIGYKGWKELRNHRFFEGLPWALMEKKRIPAPYSSLTPVNCLRKKDEFIRHWKVQEGGKKPGVYLERTFFIGQDSCN